MYPFIRLVTSLAKTFNSPKVEPSQVCTITFRCMPWDLDMFLEMNNGRVLTLYDLGRFHLSDRTGLAKVLKEKKWGFAVAGSTIRYRKRIKLFDKVTMHTQVVAYDERWSYIQQSMWVDGHPASSVLLRTAVVEKGKLVPSRKVMEALGVEDWNPEPSDWVTSWIAHEDQRPWPPQV